ncbi:hypothetical protein AMTR_s00025p00214710 [Amborella trichopoda]|uniref:Uncharacterized protein n=1 Tax=Amborella trichopoda TaxID=13333 RepID=W1PYI8_AMBTC|nr:hypothetical protein AMTR_s00025p00214710 [Amborella trichopoda]
MEYDDADMAFKCLSPIAETLDSIWEETYEETQQSLPLSFKGSHSSEILTMEHTRMEPTQISRNEENG